MKEVRFAVLGCGKIGTRHAAKLKEVEGARLVAVCDVVPERADELAREYACRSYHSIDELLKDQEADFVNVCTPSGLHAEHTIAALNAGKHVLCEKPMAIKTADALRMVEAAKVQQRKLYVVKQNRYNPPVKLVSRLLREGKLGRPLACVVNMFWNRDEDYYKNDSWRGTLALDGGTLYTQASHFVDLMLAFMGPPTMLAAFVGTQNHHIEVEDTGVIAVEFENGALGSFNYTTCVKSKNFEGSIFFIGTKSTIKIGGEYLNTIEHFDVEGVPNYELEPTTAGANDYGTYKGSMSNHDKVFQAVVAAMNGTAGGEELVSGEEAVLSVRFMEKAFESAKTGQKIRFT